MRYFLPLVITSTLLLPTTALNAQSDRLNIVTTTTILADVVQNVTGDAADVTSLMGVGTDPHSFQPTTRDIITLDEADVIFINGVSLESRLRDILEETDSSKIVPLSACVPVLRDVEHAEDDEQETSEISGEWVEQCDEYYEELNITIEGNRLYDAGCDDCDAHVWMDVQNVMLWTLLARDTLSELDPDHAPIYAENSAAYLEQLGELDDEIQSLVDTIPEDERLLVTNHNVLNYFAQRYGLDIAATVLPGFSTGAEPGPQEVLEVIQILEDTGTPAIFVDNSASADTAAQIAEEAGVEVVVLYTGSLSTADEDAATYIHYMRFNASQIVTALSGD